MSITEKKSTEENESKALADLMDSFMERYAPASCWNEASEHFTSSEIAGMFNSVYPVPLEKIYEALTEKGFKCVPLSGQASFVWLLTLKRK
ncbi:MAG: hypothetical protein EGP82_08750 [Odoribacter splanchnicus]|nr:hypothetical protein [Odoribacter splanchnicus]